MKLIVGCLASHVKASGNMCVKVFNITADPSEMYNLAVSNKELG